MLPSWACITGFGTGAARLIPRRVSGPGLAEVSAEWIKDESFEELTVSEAKQFRRSPPTTQGRMLLEHPPLEPLSH